MKEKEVAYLRRKAEQFRRLASEDHTPFSQRLLEIASDLDARADELEARLKPPH